MDMDKYNVKVQILIQHPRLKNKVIIQKEWWEMVFYSLKKRKETKQKTQNPVVLARGNGGGLRKCSHAILEAVAKN